MKKDVGGVGLEAGAELGFNAGNISVSACRQVMLRGQAVRCKSLGLEKPGLRGGFESCLHAD